RCRAHFLSASAMPSVYDGRPGQVNARPRTMHTPTRSAQPRALEVPAVLLSGSFKFWPATMRSLVKPLAALMACTVVLCVRAIRPKESPDFTTYRVCALLVVVVGWLAVPSATAGTEADIVV